MKLNKTTWGAWGLCGAIILTILVNAGVNLLQDIAQGNTQTLGNTMIWSLIPSIFAIVGALIISNQARNVIGWLVMIPALISGLDGLVTRPLHGVTVAPSEPSLQLWLAVLFANSSWVGVVFPLFFIALLFPTGKPLSPRWRWVIGYGIGLIAFFYLIGSFVERIGPDPGTYGVDWTIKSPIGFIPQEVTDAIFSSWWVLALAVLALLSALSLVLRYRRAANVEREQIKWLLAACVFFALSYVPLVVTRGEESGILGTVINLFFTIGVFSFPIAIGIAILRYRLYDIDILIRRTLIYSIITAMLALLYFGAVIVLQQFFRVLTGAGDDLAIIISTLAIAALFNPLRYRVQDAIDHRFYRRKYDAQKVSERFAATVRDEVELETLTGELLNVVNETMQPASVSLWLKKTEDGGRRTNG